MKHSWKRSFALLLAAVMTLSLLPGAALGAETSKEPVFAQDIQAQDAPVAETPAEDGGAAAMDELPAELSKVPEDEWKVFPLITQDNAITRNPDPEAPAAWGAVPDDAQLYYHSQEMSAFIHFGVNTFTGAEWGSGTEDPKVFNPTAMKTQAEADAVAEEWVQAFKDGGFKRLILVGKHHDGFCIWPSQYTERDTDSSSVGGIDVVWAVSKACTKLGLDMGFYLSPWDESAESYGYRDANGNGITKAEEDALIANGTLDKLMDYNEYYDAQLREIFGNSKYGRNGKFVEIWMDGAKGTGSMAQDYDFSKWFRTIKELQPDARCFDGNAGSGIRWCGNESGTSGDETCWQKMDIDSEGKLTPQKNVDGAEVYAKGRSNGAVWSISECDVSMHNGWFNGSQRSFDSVIDMYYNSVGHGAVWLLNVPPYKTDASGTRTGEFSEADIAQLRRIGTALEETYAVNFAAASNGATATTTQGTERTSATAGKFSASKVLDEDNSTYWTLQDGATSGQITINLGQSRVFDLVSIQEYIALGQRIAETRVEYSTDGTNWKTFANTTTVGPRRLVVDSPVAARYVRVTVTNTPECDGVPLLSSIGVYKASADMERKGEIQVPDEAVFVDERDSIFTYNGSWTNWDNDDGKESTHKGSGTAGDYVTFNFTGSQFYVMGIKDPNHGPVEVTVDDKVLGTFNTNAGSRKTKQVLYVSPGLSYGEHTVKLTVKAGTSKTYFDFDGICYVEGANGILEFSKSVYPTREGDGAAVTVKRAGGSQGEISFKVIDLPGSAVSGQHYNVVDKTFTLREGETEVSLTADTILGDASGKQFYLQIIDVTGGALTGSPTTAEVRILDRNDAMTLEPARETFTQDDPFLLPSEVGQINKLEAEYMELDASGAASGKEIRIQSDANASGGRKIGWFEPNNKAYLYYNAPRAGTYTLTLRYESGRTDANNLNKLNWGDADGKIEARSESVPSTMQNGSLTYGETSFQFTVTQAGPGMLEFYAEAKASPNIDWFTFRLDTPANGVQSVTVQPTEKTLYLNGEEREDTVQLVAAVDPADAPNRNVVWRSGSSSVADVRQDGTVVARSNGTAVITATADGKSATATITVKTRVTGEVVISGTGKFGEALTASVNQLSHQGAKEGLTYQWKRNGTAISGATTSTYTVVQADIGQPLTVTVTATGNYVGTKTSEAVNGAKADGPEVVATLDYADCTNGNNGKITGLNPARAYQYKTTASDTWQDIPGTPGATELTGLAPGSYHVRVKETATHTAGPISRTLTILSEDEGGFDVSIGTFANGRVTASARRAAAGDTITLTVLPSTGYQLKAGSLKVNDGAVAVDANRSFTMPNGPVTVTAEFELRTYTITHSLTNINCTMGQQNHMVSHGDRPTITLSPETGFRLPQTVTVRRTDGGTFSNYRYTLSADGSTGTVAFTNGIDSDLEVIGAGVPQTYDATYELTHLLAENAPRTVTRGSALTFRITPADETYTLPETIQVAVGGVALAASEYTYQTNGNVTVPASKITGNVLVTAEGTRRTSLIEGVTVTGTAQIGNQLTAVVTPSRAVVVYQWFRVDGETQTPISGATYPRYMLTAEDVGKTVLVRATGVGSYGGVQLSDPTARIEGAPAIPVSRVTLDRSSATMGVGGTLQLTPTIFPENATNKGVRWQSSNEAVASVDDRGAVYGVARGEATITVVTNNGDYTAQCAVKVEDITLDRSSASLRVGGTVTLRCVVVAEMRDKSVTWTSDDPAVVTVDENGVVTAVSEGTATVTVTTNEGGYAASCAVTVTKASSSGGGSSSGSAPAPAPAPSQTQTRDDGSKVSTVEKPDGSVAQTVEQPDGTKTETVTGKDGAVTITAAGKDGQELAKVELPAVLPENEAGFVDLDAVPWAEKAINNAAGLELVKGIGDNKYDPIAPMTRGALATVLHRLSQGKTDYNITFKDVAQGKYYAEGVAWAAKANVVKGISEDVFAPEETITREQLAVMLARYANLLGLNTKANTNVLKRFADSKTTGAWAMDGVAWCVERGILKGRSSEALDPAAEVSRAEVAVMLDRFLTLLK